MNFDPTVLQPLGLLLKVSSQDHLYDILNHTFSVLLQHPNQLDPSIGPCSWGGSTGSEYANKIRSYFGETTHNPAFENGFAQLGKSLLYLLQVIFRQSLPPSSIPKLFPPQMNQNLVSLISNFIQQKHKFWSKLLTLKLPSAKNQLINFDWRVDIVSLPLSGESRISSPKVIITLDMASLKNGSLSLETKSMALDKKQLGSLISQLHKLQKQISQLAQV